MYLCTCELSFKSLPALKHHVTEKRCYDLNFFPFECDHQVLEVNVPYTRSSLTVRLINVKDRQMIMKHLMQRMRILLKKLSRDKLIDVYFCSKLINKSDRSEFRTFKSTKHAARYSYINKAIVSTMMNQIDVAVREIECPSNLIECFSMEIIFIKNLTPKPHPRNWGRDDEE
jgi:hypothetical protein